MTACVTCGWTVGHNPSMLCGSGERYMPGRQETSDLAWESVEHKLSGARLAALFALYAAKTSGLTGGEANVGLTKGEGNPSYHRRLSELVDMGLAVRNRKRPCKVSKKMAWEYLITPKGQDAIRRVEKEDL